MSLEISSLLLTILASAALVIGARASLGHARRRRAIQKELSRIAPPTAGQADRRPAPRRMTVTGWCIVALYSAGIKLTAAAVAWDRYRIDYRARTSFQWTPASEKTEEGA